MTHFGKGTLIAIAIVAILGAAALAMLRPAPPQVVAPGTATSTPAETPSAPEEDDAALRREIGQMILVGFRGTAVAEDSKIVQEIEKNNVGGVVFFDRDVPSGSATRNVTGPAQIKKLVADLQSYAPTPLFIAVDAEGGAVNRLQPKYGFITVPSHADLGKGSVAHTAEVAAALAEELRGLGINMNLAPVADVNVNPANPIIGALGRSFSSDPALVTAHADAFRKAHNGKGIISVIKHFPGHGSSGTDSHLGLAEVTATYRSYELDPFRALIRSGADAVMTAHIMDRKVDPDYPATLSPKFINGILRGDLGFKGVVISDDMQMGAITRYYGFKDALIRAVNSGVDILAISNNISTYDPEISTKTADIVFEAVKSGAIPRERIAEAYARITALKRAYGILP